MFEMTTFNELAEQTAVYAQEIMRLKADRDELLKSLKKIARVAIAATEKEHKP